MSQVFPIIGRLLRLELACALAVLMVAAPVFPNGAPLAMAFAADASAPWEEDDQEIPAEVRVTAVSAMPKPSRPARTTQLHGQPSRCPLSSRALLRPAPASLCNPPDHFHNGLGTPRLC